jgi:hypothetical protein
MQRELSGEDDVTCSFSPVIKQLLSEAPMPAAAQTSAV